MHMHEVGSQVNVAGHSGHRLETGQRLRTGRQMTWRY